MNLLPSVFLGIVFLFFFELTLAQSDYRPGFIINSKQDTTTGFLLYKTNSSRFEYCTFKSSENSESKEYSSQQILGYGFLNDTYYESKDIKTSESAQRRFFVEILVKGKASLLQLNDKFYIEDSENQIYLLEVITSEVITHKKFLATQELFKGTLSWKFADCPKITKAIKSSKLEEKSLTQLFELYNSCFSEVQSSPKNTKTWSEFHIGLTGGFSITSFTKPGDVFKNGILDEKQFKRDMSLMGGISMKFTVPRISERFSTNLEIIYQLRTNESVKKETNTYDVVSLEYTSLIIPMSIEFTFTSIQLLNFKPSLELGVNSSWTLSHTSYWNHERTESNNNIVTDRTDPLINPNLLYVTPFLGIGMTTNLTPKIKAFVKTRFQSGSGSILNTGISGITFSTGVLYKL